MRFLAVATIICHFISCPFVKGKQLEDSRRLCERTVTYGLEAVLTFAKSYVFVNGLRVAVVGSGHGKW